MLEEVVFYMADIFDSHSVLGSRYTLLPDGNPSVLLKRLTAPLARLYILLEESLIAVK